jgi:cyanophycinase
MIKYLLIALFSFSTYASTLILVGGGKRPADALNFFISKIKNPVIYVLPWGTSYPVESFLSIKSELDNLGVPLDIRCICDEGFSLDDYDGLSNAGGIYFPGGNQNKFMARIKRTKTKQLFKKLYASNIPIAGTSAGTAIQSNPMLTGRGIEMSEGLGLLSNILVDQHFLVRNREERLVNALSNLPGFVGIGIDEDMSAVIVDSSRVTAIGPSVVSIYQKIGNTIKKVQLSDQQSYNLKEN